MSKSKLFDDLKELTDHEVTLTIGQVRPPKQLRRFGHPVLADFPSIEGPAYEALRDDIRLNGQQVLIAMRDGYVWNGRARYRACLELNLVPKVDLLRRGDPVQYLMDMHTRFGRPYSDEWLEARKKLSRVQSREWKETERGNRSAWMIYARDEFKRKVSRPQACAVCGMSHEYSHAHHSLPLNIQYDLGIEAAVHAHDWLCHVHHKLIHQHLSRAFLGTKRRPQDDSLERYADTAAHGRARQSMLALVTKARQLFVAAGGWPYDGKGA